MPSDHLNAQQQSVVDWLNGVEDRGGASTHAGGIGQFKRDLIQRLDALPVAVPGQARDAVTLFYSGPLGDQTKSGWEVAESIGEASKGQVVTIGETPLGSLQNHLEFKDALTRAAGTDNPHLAKELTDGVTPSGAKVESIWDRASARLADGARGDVRTLTPYAADDKVFATQELPALLKNPQVTHLNGVPVEAYREIYAHTPGPESAKLSQVNRAVQASSFELTRGMRWSEVPHTGRGAGHFQVDPGQVFEGTPYTAPPHLAATHAASFDASRADPSLTPAQVQRIQAGRAGLTEAVSSVVQRTGPRADGAVAQAMPHTTHQPKPGAVANAANAVHGVEAAGAAHVPKFRAGTVLKGLGLAGTAYGLYEGYGDFSQAIDGAVSTRDQHVRGAEAAADLGARAAISGTAAAGGGFVGGAGGSLVMPGPGTVGGAVLVGGAAAYGAERAYEGSRVQQWSKTLGRGFGEISYDHFSKEGRLLGQLNRLKEDLAEASTPAERQRLQTELGTVGEAFKTEADKNNAYFDGRGQIEQGWEAMSARFPSLDKGDVVKAYEARLEAGKAPAEAARAGYSDAVHDRVQPRGWPHVPEANYGAYDNKALQTAWTRYSGEVAADQRGLKALEARGPEASRMPLVGGWLSERNHHTALEAQRDEQWRDHGHVSAIEAEMRARGGMMPPGRSAETPERAERAGVEGRGAANLRSQPLSPLSQTLLIDSEKQVRQLASTHGLRWDKGLDNTVCSVARCAREQGLTGINLMRVTGDGQIRYGHHDSLTLKDGTLDARQAANTPAAESVARMGQLDQQHAALEVPAREPMSRAM